MFESYRPAKTANADSANVPHHPQAKGELIAHFSPRLSVVPRARRYLLARENPLASDEKTRLSESRRGTTRALIFYKSSV